MVTPQNLKGEVVQSHIIAECQSFIMKGVYVHLFIEIKPHIIPEKKLPSLD